MCFNYSWPSRDSAASEGGPTEENPPLLSYFDLRHEPFELACVENVSAQCSESISHGFFSSSVTLVILIVVLSKVFLPITSPLSVINANESRNCDERLLISNGAASAPNSACLPQNKSHANGSKNFSTCAHLQVMFFRHLILASKQF